MEAMSRFCPFDFLNVPNFVMPFVRHAFEVVHGRRMHKMLRTKISFEVDLAECSHCCLPPSFSFFYLKEEV